MTQSAYDSLKRNEPAVVWWSGNPGHPSEPDQLHGMLPGSFNPLHDGHTRLQEVAEQQLGGRVAFELAVINVEKPALDQSEIDRRCRQFSGQPVAVTNTPMFLQKCQLFPGVTFVVGADTAARLLDARFYDDNEFALHQALSTIGEWRCRFLVAARMHKGRLLRLEDLAVPHPHRRLFDSISPDLFRLDLSSTILRNSQSADEL